MLQRTGIGQDSHRFQEETSTKPCIIAGLVFDSVPGFDANSDGDVVFHAITNAISTLTGTPILGAVADALCKEGVTDSKAYLDEAMKTLGDQEIVHVSLAIEGKRPKMKERYHEIRQSVADALSIKIEDTGIMATTGEELTAFGKGEGVQCIAIVTTKNRG